MWAAVIISILFVAAYYLYRHFTKYNNYWKERNVPGPEPTFFFGNIKDLTLRRNAVSQIYKNIYDQYPEQKYIGIFRMRSPVLLVKDPEIIRHVLINDSDAFLDRNPKLLNDKTPKRDHTERKLRSLFTPLFTSGKLKNMVPIMNKCANRFLNHVDEIIRHQPDQEIHGLIKKFTQENIAACTFGLNLDSYNQHSEILKDLDKNSLTRDHRADLEMMYPGILKYLGIPEIPKKTLAIFSDLAKEIIAQRNGVPSDRKDLLDVLLAARGDKNIHEENDNQEESTFEITDAVIAIQMFAFYMAGYHTSANAMSFMLHQLARDNDIQDKVVAEIEVVLQKYGGELSYEAIADLKYMEQVFNETLRLYPVGDVLRRWASADYEVPGTDLTVERGQIIIIPVNVVHLDPKNYVDPKKFDPERFTPENEGARHSCAFLPFGGGPRKCIGTRFAMFQMKIGMAALLSRFRVEPSKDTPDRFHYESSRRFTFPVGGFPMKLVHKCVKAVP